MMGCGILWVNGASLSAESKMGAGWAGKSLSTCHGARTRRALQGCKHLSHSV